MINVDSQVTICIPAYNADRFIAQTLNSIVKQSPSAREVFVSDNYSTDQTRVVVAQFAAQGVQLVQCPVLPVNTGAILDNCRSACNNWNSLVQYGSGQYVALYHADDVYEPGIVATQARFLDQHPECSVVFTMGIVIDEEDRRIHIWNSLIRKWLEKERLFDYPSLVQGLLEWGCFLWAPTAMIRRAAWLQVGGLNPAYEQACDMEWWLRFAQVWPVGVINKDLIKRRVSRYHDSANAKIIYRYRALPFFNVLDGCLAKGGLGALMPTEILMKYELQRAGDLVGPAMRHISEGRLQPGMEKLEGSADISLGALAAAVRAHPRTVLQVLLGKALGLACRAGCGRMLAQQLAKHSSIFNR